MSRIGSYNIAVLPGDGIGPEVVAEAVKVLAMVAARFGHSFDLRYAEFGGAAIDAFGVPFPPATEAICRDADAVEERRWPPALAGGFRTGDICREGMRRVGCVEMGQLIADRV